MYFHKFQAPGEYRGIYCFWNANQPGDCLLLQLIELIVLAVASLLNILGTEQNYISTWVLDAIKIIVVTFLGVLTLLFQQRAFFLPSLLIFLAPFSLIFICQA